jgi:O-antigen/teichoic acid export membrane protein
VLLWALSGAISSADPDESREIVAQFCRVSILMLLGLGLVIAAAAPAVLPLVFGGNYRPAVPSVLLLLPGMVCYAPAIIFAEYFVVQGGMPGRAALIPAVSLVVSTVLNFPLTPALGAAGASMASSISYAAMLLTAVVLFARHTHRSPVTILRITRADLLLLGGVLWRGARA